MSNIDDNVKEEFNIGNMAPVVAPDQIISKDKSITLPDNTVFDEEEPEDEKFKECSFDDIDSFCRYYNDGEYVESTAGLVGYLSTVGVMTTIIVGKQISDFAHIRTALKLYCQNNKVKYPYDKVVFKSYKLNTLSKNINDREEMNPIQTFLHKHSKNSMCLILFPDKEHTSEKDQILRVIISGDNNDKCDVEYIDSDCKKHTEYYTAIIGLKIKKELGNISMWADNIKKQYTPKTKGEKEQDVIKESFNALDLSPNSVTPSPIPEPLTPIDLSNTEIVTDTEPIEVSTSQIAEVNTKKDNNYKEMQQALKSGNLKKLNELINERKEILKELPENPDVITEARPISDEIVDIVEMLNSKGYKVKYSSPGYPSERRKEDIYKDGVLNGKLYTSARLVFKKDYKFKDVPKGWELKVMDNDAIGLYVKNPTYKITDGVPKEALYNWKSKYMGNLRRWAERLKPVTSDGEEPVKKESVYDIEDVFNDIMIDSL